MKPFANEFGLVAPRVTAALVLVLYTVIARAQCPGSFLPPKTSSVGDLPAGIAAADFNSDGRPDLVVTNALDDNVTVLYRTAAGGFISQNLTAGIVPLEVRISDFDGNGRPDIVTTNRDGMSISIMRANPSGSFHPTQHYPVAPSPIGIAVGDFNGDGRPDVATTHFSESRLSILLANADGTLQAARFAPLPNPGYGAASADFNRDGRADLAVSLFNQQRLVVLISNADGTFATGPQYVVGGTPIDVVAADFNSDAHADLVVVNNTSAHLSLLLGSGGGAFAPALSVPVGVNALRAAVQDFDLDGRPDLAIARANAQAVVAILLAQAGGPAGSFGAPLYVAAPSNPYGVAVADFNGDGRPDVATVNQPTDNASVFLSVGQFGPPVIAGPQPQAVPPLGTATFSVSVEGNGHQFRWQVGGTPLVDGGRVSGSQTDTLEITDVQPGDQGEYRLVVTNRAGCIGTTPAAPLSCRPIIVEQPIATSPLFAGLELTVAVPPDATYSYRWRRNQSNLFNVPGQYSGVTTATLRFLSMDAALNGSYDVVLTNVCGATTSEPSAVTCLPIITQQPAATAFLVGGTTLEANVQSLSEVSFRWVFGTVELSDTSGDYQGSHTRQLRILRDRPELMGNYRLRATNACGATLSTTTAVECGPPTITIQPPAQVILAPGVSATVTAPPGTAYTYLWQQGLQPVPEIPGVVTGATSPTITFHVPDPALAGSYVVRVASPCGTTESSRLQVFCPSDFNHDTFINPDDLGDYINCYFANPPCSGADFTADGNVDADDLADFINAYFGEC